MLQMDWKRMLSAIALFLFLLILFATGGKSSQWNALALGGLMIVLWVFEVVSIYITALLPIVLAIPLGLLTKDDLALCYGNNNVHLFLGGFVMALALEKWHVHEQIARRILTIMGDTKPRILLGFLLSTALLSMWISNTATALMMLPIAVAIVESMPKEHQKSKFSLFLMLSIAYAASIGGMGTLVGSPPNTQMASILENNFNITVDFWTWMKIGIPVSLTLIIALFGVFYFMLGDERKDRHDFHLEKKPWTAEQLRALAIFGVVIILWSFRELITSVTGFDYKDESAAILGAIAMFIVPGKSEKTPLLVWKDTEKLPWGILLLFGGGMALATIFEKNGIVEKISEIFEKYSHFPLIVILLVIVIIGIFVTEVMSNLALVTILTPIVAVFAQQSGYDILQLCIPLTLAASCAFMLPVGTPPNAIVFSSGMIKIHQMAKIGFIINIISVLIVTAFAFLI